MKRRTFAHLFNMMFAMVLIIAFAGSCIFFSEHVKNIVFLGKCIAAIGILYLIYVVTTWQREEDAYWNEQDRLAAEKKRRNNMYQDLSGL